MTSPNPTPLRSVCVLPRQNKPDDATHFIRLKSIGWIILVAVTFLLVSVSNSRAGLAIPYTPDAHTMHLWHLNEASGQFATDSASNSVSGAVPILLESLGLPTGTFPFTNTTLGGVGTTFPGLTNAYVGTSKAHLLAGYNGTSYGGLFPDVSQFCNSNTGAFTFEALINLNATLASIDAEILTGDNGSGIGARGWQWRIENGAMEWDLLAGSTDNDFKPLLPSSGPDAAKTNAWYHVAVTFTGQSPTNGDASNVLTFYWTALDPSRTAADMLGQFTNATPNGIRPLSGAPEGAATPALGIAGSARNTTSNPGNNEGVIGAIMEVRVSDIARASNAMAFSTNGAFPPKIVFEPVTNTLVGYGQPLLLGPVVSGSQPLTYRWFQNGALVPTQTNLDLSFASTTFANGGSYYSIISNAYGTATTTVAQVTVGAIATGLYPTGIDTNGQSSAGDIPDPHYMIVNSSDPSGLGPNAQIFEWNSPIQFSPGGGNNGPTNGYSTWTGLYGNPSGVTTSSPAGPYTYRTTFLIDQADPTTVTLSGTVIFPGTITNILLNGKSTGVSLTEINALFIPSPFTITNGFVAGINTLDFCDSLPSAQVSDIYVELISAIGQALPAGKPSILHQPADITVKDAVATGSSSSATFSVVATGRPPLTYQWRADGVTIPTATNYTYNIYNPSAGTQGSNYTVVIVNDSGSVTSSVAVLTISPTNQPPVAQPLNLVSFNGQPANIQLAQLIDIQDSDPDHDSISIVSVDSGSTIGNSNGMANVTQNGATLSYTPVPGFVGQDQFTYQVGDVQGATTIGVVNILNLAEPNPLTTVLVGGTTNLNVGLTNVPAGLSFQWKLAGTNLPGATSAQLVISNAQAANAGAYLLAVTDPQGNVVNSSIARVALNGAPMPRFNTTPTAWVFNGYGAAQNLVGNVLTLTDGAISESRSAWFGWPQEITNFNASFVYRDVGGLGADGFTFVLQNSPNGTAALGGGGGGLGYSGLANSVALQFNIYSNNTPGIALQSGGTVTTPYNPTSPVNLASGDPISVNISYSAGVASVSLTDLTTALSTNFVIDATTALGDTFENLVGTNIAYVGFTGGDGAVASTQTITGFTFRPPSLPLAVQSASNNSVVLSWTPPYSGFVLQSSSSLVSGWQSVTNSVTAVGNQFKVQVPLATGPQFFRLMLP